MIAETITKYKRMSSFKHKDVFSTYKKVWISFLFYLRRGLGSMNGTVHSSSCPASESFTRTFEARIVALSALIGKLNTARSFCFEIG